MIKYLKEKGFIKNIHTLHKDIWSIKWVDINTYIWLYQALYACNYKGKLYVFINMNQSSLGRVCSTISKCLLSFNFITKEWLKKKCLWIYVIIYNEKYIVLSHKKKLLYWHVWNRSNRPKGMKSITIKTLINDDRYVALIKLTLKRMLNADRLRTYKLRSIITLDDFVKEHWLPLVDAFICNDMIMIEYNNEI